MKCIIKLLQLSFYLDPWLQQRVNFILVLLYLLCPRLGKSHFLTERGRPQARSLTQGTEYS